MGKSITDLLSVTTVGLDLAKHVFQVHCVELQVLASLTRDPPTGEECDAVREQKAALLKAVRPLDVAHVVRGQYASYRSRADRDYRMSRHDDVPRTNFRSTASVLKLVACLATRKGVKASARR